MNSLILKKGRERSLKRRHPWIFSGAVEKGGGKAGETLEVRDNSGKVLAHAAYSPQSQIRARVWTFDPAEAVDAAFFRNRIQKALVLRDALPAAKHTNALRLVNGESDGLPGLVVDRYADVLVAQFLAAGVERWRDPVLDALTEISGCEAIFERSDAEVRKLEGLEPRVGFARGNRDAQRCPIIEYGLNFRVDVEAGQKTGFFLDQRENRRLARTLAGGKRVLNLFSYSGAFGVYAAAGGAASVTNVDVSAPAIEAARENASLNGVVAEQVVADAFQYVRQKHGPFDLVVCDPPAFAKSRNEVERAARGYKDVNLYAMRMIAPGGMMMTFSCSGHLSLDLFQKVMFAAALDAGRRISFVRRLTAGPDHPVSMYCPEGEYLKGFLLEVH
ncbi:MAG TPA: class I SAM-dependent rRNA methyltransferase [Thermoanaerobaculia bacterium]|nr:class I SAM-dependent rRNA methyltransferase [Thermoanaerobaculia bacterium]